MALPEGISPADLIRIGDTVLYQRRRWSLLRILVPGDPRELEIIPRSRRPADAFSVRAPLSEARVRELGISWRKSNFFTRRYSCIGSLRGSRFWVHDRRTRTFVTEGLDYWVAIRVADLLEAGHGQPVPAAGEEGGAR